MSLANSKFNVSWLRKIVTFRKSVRQWWHHNSGDWHWLSDKPMPVNGINRKLWRAAVPSWTFYVLMCLSSAISTFGLLANSVATIIGAMIIAPLMGPIISIAYSLVSGNRRLLKRSTMTTFWGVTLNIVLALGLALPLGLENFGSEVTGRISPSLLDLGVALAAGAAGAFAQSRKHVADALPGVAIAVALVPPLSVIGIGLSSANYRIAGGAALLFVTNFIGIIFSGCIVFLIQQYGTVERAKTSLFAGIVSIVLLGIPLGISLNNILFRDNVRREVLELLQTETSTFRETVIESLKADLQSNGTMRIELDVIAKQGTISQKQVQLVRSFLSQRFERPVVIKLKVIPAEIFEEQEATSNQS